MKRGSGSRRLGVEYGHAHTPTTHTNDRRKYHSYHHANGKAHNASCYNPYDLKVLTFRGTVVRRSRAQHRRPRVTAQISSKGAVIHRTGFVGVGFQWKNTRTSTSIRHSRYRGTAVTQQENQRVEISMNDINNLAKRGRGATSVLVAARLVAELR
ncbi:unnamed protein product [Pieris macdunnoughi]|uniref:Uncharacterized protein n=1 Tax=Pieris macdunnoughi TaxID=345717 RepID=A0A821LW75_9NEOP|nr:unnamed protein product [Pieris macdunnoughi]